MELTEFFNNWTLTYFILCVVLVEAITEIITKSALLSPIRAFFFRRRKYRYTGKISEWIHNLLDCGYCTSVWIGWFAAYFVFCTDPEDTLLEVFVFGLIFHRLANILHYLIDVLDLKRTRDL